MPSEKRWHMCPSSTKKKTVWLFTATTQTVYTLRIIGNVVKPNDSIDAE